MNTGVVHDSHYFNYYLVEIERLDKRWRLPARVEYALADILVAAALVTAVAGYFLPVFVWVPVVCVWFALFFAYSAYIRRLNRSYVQVSKKYLRRLIPDAIQVFSRDDIIVYGKTRLRIDAGEVMYYCGLRTLAESEGQQGWSVEFEQPPEGSFADMQAWVNSRPKTNEA